MNARKESLSQSVNESSPQDNPRNPRLRIALGAGAGILVAGATTAAIYPEIIPSHDAFNPDQCAEGSPSPGKGGNSAVYHAFENMEPSVTTSDQTIASLGRQANDLYGGTMDVSDAIKVCVDLENGIAKVSHPSVE